MLWRVWETTAALTEHCWLVGSFGKGGSRYACACVYVCFMLKSHGVIGCVVPYIYMEWALWLMGGWTCFVAHSRQGFGLNYGCRMR